MNFFRGLTLSLLVFLSWGCSPKAFLEKLAPSGDRDRAQHFISLLQSKDLEGLSAECTADLKSPESKKGMAQVANMLPVAPPLSTQLVGYYVSYDSNTGAQTSVSFEFHFPDQWELINVVMVREGNRQVLAGVHVTPLPKSLEEINQFTLVGRSLLQYVVLALSVVVPLFILYALVRCIRTKVRRKWLWILFIIFGLGKLTVNWTSGEWAWSVMTIQLFGVSAFAQLFGPWIISVSCPLGAVIFLLRHGGKKASADGPPDLP